MSNSIVQITGSFEGWLKHKYGNSDNPENVKTLDSIDMKECWLLVAEKAKDDLANIDEIKKSIWGTNSKEFALKLQDALTRTKAAIEGKSIMIETTEKVETNKFEAETIDNEVEADSKNIDNEFIEESEEVENINIPVHDDEESEVEDEINIPTHDEENSEEVEDIQIPTHDDEQEETEDIQIPVHDDETEEEISIPTHDDSTDSTSTEDTDLDDYAKAFEAEVEALKNSGEYTSED